MCQHAHRAQIPVGSNERYNDLLIDLYITMPAYTGDDGWLVLFSEFGVLRWMREWREWATRLLNRELYLMERLATLRWPATFRDYLPGGSEAAFVAEGPGDWEDRIFYSRRYKVKDLKDWLHAFGIGNAAYRRGVRRLGPGY